MFRGDDAINALAKAHGVRVADVLQAFIVTASQSMTTPQSIHESSGAYSDSPVSQSSGLRSISLLRGWRC
jgi:hypothetical protein